MLGDGCAVLCSPFLWLPVNPSQHRVIRCSTHLRWLEHLYKAWIEVWLVTDSLIAYPITRTAAQFRSINIGCCAFARALSCFSSAAYASVWLTSRNFRICCHTCMSAARSQYCAHYSCSLLLWFRVRRQIGFMIIVIVVGEEPCGLVCSGQSMMQRYQM